MADRVLVCGGRNLNDWKLVSRSLEDLHKRTSFSVLMHGGAKGADWCAGYWARNFPALGGRCPLRVLVFPANWRKHGFAAGPIRNQQMLDEGKPDLVVAFPGGRGTADMVRRAKAAGVEVLEIPTPNTDARLNSNEHGGEV